MMVSESLETAMHLRTWMTLPKLAGLLLTPQLGCLRVGVRISTVSELRSHHIVRGPTGAAGGGHGSEGWGLRQKCMSGRGASLPVSVRLGVLRVSMQTG
jgi:hypothetical protein